jgi:hypothetical protein
MLSNFAGNPSPDMREDNLRQRYARHGTAHVLERNQGRPAARHNPGRSRR